MALDRDGIKAIIPHREPFLLIDRIVEYVPGESATGELDVVEDMFWVPGHFPDYAVMPGVLIVEACAQVGAVALLALPENQGRIAFFAGIDKVRFKRQVRPGETLRDHQAPRPHRLRRSEGLCGRRAGLRRRVDVRHPVSSTAARHGPLYTTMARSRRPLPEAVG
jgi:3-hydroxyacyl-[acyl-carrier-protein] dehydratase